MRVMMVGYSNLASVRRPVAWLLERGHEVLLVDYQDRYEGPRSPRLRFVPLLATRGSRVLRRLLGEGGSRGVRRLAGAAQLRLLAARFRPDVIHAHNINFQTECCAQAQLSPLVVSALGTLNFLLIPGFQEVEEATVRRVLDATSLLIVDSPGLCAPARALTRQPLRVEWLGWGADTTRFRPGYTAERVGWRARLGLDAETFVFLSPRGWAGAYQHHRIVQAFAEARPHFHRAAALVFLTMGLDHYLKAGEYLQYVRDLVERLGVEAHTHWLPRVPYERMPELYALADAVVSYPMTDAFPSTLVEAAAAEVPILASDLPTYAGTIIEQLATRVPPDDTGALAQAMVTLVNQPPAARAPRLAAARRLVVAQHDERLIAARLLALYERVRGPAA